MPSLSVLVSHVKWDEDRSVTTTPRVTPAHVEFSAPDIDATIQTEYLMTYLPDGNAEFVFVDTIKADNFQGRKGTFIAHGKGTFNGEAIAVNATFDIVAGSGTGDLEKIKGAGGLARPRKILIR